MNDEMRMNLYWPDAGWKAECHEERSQGKCRSNPDEIFYEGAAVSSIWMTRNPNNTLYNTSRVFPSSHFFTKRLLPYQKCALPQTSPSTPALTRKWSPLRPTPPISPHPPPAKSTAPPVPPRLSPLLSRPTRACMAVLPTS